MRVRVATALFVIIVCSTNALQPEAWALDGTPLYPPTLSGVTLEALNAQVSIAEDDIAADACSPQHDPAKQVWLGRLQGAKWQFREALLTLSSAIKESPSTFPINARLHRHRGHRYITLRNFSKAEADLEIAATLIAKEPHDGWEPNVEPNDMPYNLPLQSHFFSVYYHLGLSKILKGDFASAAQVYEKMQRVVAGQFANDESISATAHWHYMALRRSGASSTEAGRALSSVHPGMRTLDGTGYLDLALWYKGERPAPNLKNVSALDFATIGYGVGAHHFYSGDQKQAIAVWQEVVNSTYWAAFGYIAAEAELYRLGVPLQTPLQGPARSLW